MKGFLGLLIHLSKTHDTTGEALRQFIYLADRTDFVDWEIEDLDSVAAKIWETWREEIQ